jgi:hypothetical protein
MNEADFVVAAGPGNGRTTAFLPAGRVEGAPLMLVRSLPNFELLARFPLCTKRTSKLSAASRRFTAFKMLRD